MAVLICVGALFVLLGVPLAQRKVPRNHLYGARFAQTLADEGVWWKVNERVGAQMIYLGASTVLAGVASSYMFRGLGTAAQVIGPSLLLLCGVVGIALRAYVYARNLSDGKE